MYKTEKQNQQCQLVNNNVKLSNSIQQYKQNYNRSMQGAEKPTKIITHKQRENNKTHLHLVS